MLKRIVHLLAFLLLISAAPTLAQQPTQPDTESAEVKELIRRAGLKILEYRNGFKDLTAEEEQTIEEYDGQGKVKKQRRVSSDLFIYQSQLDPTQMVEYRDVKAVDGVAVKKRDTRLVNLLTKSAKAESVQKELDRINRESARYDLNSSSHGMTLNQAILLSENMRPSFQYKLAGHEQVNGHDAIVLEYQQISSNPEITMKFSSLPGHLKGAETRYRGRLWLDAGTAQLRREVRELTIEHPSLKQPLVLMKHEFDYADSRFGFLTPQRIVFSTYTRGRTGADKQPELLLGGRITVEYGAFTRFSVDAPDATVNPPAKP